MPCVQDELGPAGAGPTEPDEGLGPVDGTVAAGPRPRFGLLCGPAPISDVAKSRAKLVMANGVPKAARAVFGFEDFLFIFRSDWRFVKR
jgi:hypothetical protein